MALPRKTEEALDLIRALERSDARPDPALVRAALSHRSGQVVARAAKLVQEHDFNELGGEVARALLRLLPLGRERDPGCTAKLALAEALDHMGQLDPEPFEAGVGLRQLEPSWGPPVDTATGLRVRCGLALARILGPEALPALAELLADPEPAVRREAPRAVALAGGPGAEALLRLKGRVGDSDPGEGPDILAEVVGSLAQLDQAAALAVARPRVLGDAPPSCRPRVRDPATQTQIAVVLALGEARVSGTIGLVDQWLEQLGDDRGIRAAVTAVAVLRDDAARGWLLSQLATARSPVAEHAVRALEIFRMQGDLEPAARHAAARNPHVDLAAVLDEVFGG